MYKKDELIELAKFVKGKAKERGKTATYNGSWQIGGEAALVAQVDAFMSGLAETLPTGWLNYYEEMQNAKIDPDHAAYLRYKIKHNL